MKSAKFWIERLSMETHPEGGYYKEVYRSNENIPEEALPARYNGERSFATAIYFLLNEDNVSSFHRIQSDETWHFYQGTTLELFVLDEQGNLERFLLGTDFDQGERLQITIPKNHWFGSRVIDHSTYALLGCTVAPGFHFDDFELAERGALIQQFPQHERIISELTFE